MLTLEPFYLLGGALVGFTAARIAVARDHPRRWGSTVFWTLLAVVFVAGKHLPPVVVGYLLLAMVGLTAAKQVGLPAVKGPAAGERVAEAERLGNRIFLPALLVPAFAVAGSLGLGRLRIAGRALVDEQQIALVSLGVGAVVAIFVARRLTRARYAAAAGEGARLIEALGWTLILPQLLAALGGVFQQAGVGSLVADLVGRVLPTQYPFVAVAAYCLAMALFTVCLGNAFAAFAVITSGLGVPLIVQQHHGNPAIMAAIGMLSGYCGTLLTPMAANFNIVPVMLLELPDKNAVIRTQAPIAVTLLAVNILLMYVCVYRF